MEIILKNIIWLAVILAAIFFVRKIKFKHGSMLGELFVGIILGNLGLIGIHFFEPMAHSSFLEVLSEIVIAFFLFRIGFSTTLGSMLKTGQRALSVAILGVAATFGLAFYFTPAILPGLSIQQYIFIAAALSTTSVAITVRLLKEYKQLQTQAAQIVLEAAVFDDIISLLILAVVMTAFTSSGQGHHGAYESIGKILLFIILGIITGQFLAKFLPKFFYKIYPSVKVGYLVAALFFIVFFIGSKLAGLSTIVGAFIGGLVLERKFLNMPFEKEYGRKIESGLEKLSNFAVPIFFVVTGSRLNLVGLFSFQTLRVAVGLLVIAIIGKLVCGLAVRKEDNRWLVSWAMVPRGEVGLVFANIAFIYQIIPQEIISSIIIVVIITTFMTPAILRRTLL